MIGGWSLPLVMLTPLVSVLLMKLAVTRVGYQKGRLVRPRSRPPGPRVLADGIRPPLRHPPLLLRYGVADGACRVWRTAGLRVHESARLRQGVLRGDALMMALQGQPASALPDVFAGPHAGKMPLNNQVVDLGPDDPR